MGLLDNLAARFGFVRKGAKRGSGFAAAEIGRLTSSLRSDTEFINTTLRYQLRTLRARSRQATMNNPFARRFAQMVVDNVCGHKPFALESCVKFKTGKDDEKTNDLIEIAYDDWGKKGNCEMTGRWSWAQTQRLMVRLLAVDGEILLRIHKGPEFGPYGFKIQIVDVDRLWEQKNEALKSGGAIHMGIEVDPNGTPVAYHLLKRKPSQWQNVGYTYEFEVVPASEMMHVFIPEAAEQHRGVPWMYAALVNLTNMGAFEEAAVINARIGASQMGFITTPDGDGPPGDRNDSNGTPEFDVEPGTFRKLADGEVIESWNPAFPQAAVEPFIKAMLRGVAAGLGVAYHNLANDLEGVNYSSARIGELDERDSWKVLQAFYIEHLLDPLIGGKWLPQVAIAGKLPFPVASIDKYRALYFQPRRWQWVDPLKETTANLDAIAGKLTSRTRVIAEQGDDIEDVFDELEQEAAMLADRKLSDPVAAPAKPPAMPDDSEDEAKPAKGRKAAKPWDEDAIGAGLTAIAAAMKAKPAPIVNVAAPVVNVEARAPQVDVHLPPPVAMEREAIRNKDGVIMKLVDRPVKGNL